MMINGSVEITDPAISKVHEASYWLTKDIRPKGTVFSSFSFNDVPVNVLTGAGYDPITDTAELKVCPVRIEPCPTRGDVAAD